MPKILDSINNPNDIKNIAPEDYDALAHEIRRFLIKNISKTGGHVASNLGVVELTMALHLCLDLPKDKIVWDVGHQAYTHKILTGRKDQFTSLRKYKGLSGFPKTEESQCDAFDTGHSSTSISVALGMAKARDLMKRDNKVVAVIGDGALSGGMAYEALNNAARLKSNMVIVLNDNNMSITENVGGMANYLGKIRTGNVYTQAKVNVQSALRKVPVVGAKVAHTLKTSKDTIKRLVIPGMLFEDMGLTYIGPIDGHDTELLIRAFKNAMKAKEAVIVHVVTKKGKGYRFAEENPSKFHGIGKFEAKTGESVSSANIGDEKVVKEETEVVPVIDNKPMPYTEIFSEKLVSLGKDNEKIIAISAAMINGTGLAAFGKAYPKRLVDVGIAEEHAVTFAAGLSAGGMVPVVALYSTFLQRAYDQIVHDVCLNNQHVVFAIDRAGIVGPDGSTHQGIYDISFLRTIPKLTIIAPKDRAEFEKMLEYVIEFDGPIAIRYPKGNAYTGFGSECSPIEYGKAEIISCGDKVSNNTDTERNKLNLMPLIKANRRKKVSLFAFGSMVEVAKDVSDLLLKENIDVTIVNLRFAAPLDKNCIIEQAKNSDIVVTMEENVYNGGIGQAVSAYFEEEKIDVCSINVSICDEFIEHGDRDLLLTKLGLDAYSIYDRIMEKV